MQQYAWPDQTSVRPLVGLSASDKQQTTSPSDQHGLPSAGSRASYSRRYPTSTAARTHLETADKPPHAPAGDAVYTSQHSV
jgi:hypothetical protein